MARIRTIKPEFPQSESMGRISRDARLLFILLWTICDDAGRSRGDSRLLKGLLYPYDEVKFADIEGWLAELATENCITLYTVDGSRYLAVRNWLTHQKIDRPSKSKFPDPPDPLAKAREDSPQIIEGSSGDLGSRTKDLGEDQGPGTLASEPEDSARGLDAVRIAYPKFAGRQDWITPAHHLALRIREGCTWQQLVDAATRYARFCDATQRTGTDRVMGPTNFFSAVDKPWTQPWDLPVQQGRQTKFEQYHSQTVVSDEEAATYGINF
jgi:hypothetical protein